MVELLVVSTIIIILSAVGLVSFTAAGKKGRDGKRATDMQAVRSALEMYRSQNGAYPSSTTWTGLMTDISSYLNTASVNDPKGWAYTYTPSGSTYTLKSAMETVTTSPNVTTCPAGRIPQGYSSCAIDSSITQCRCTVTGL
jgi:type II secretory pathway pseudopilin PulG